MKVSTVCVCVHPLLRVIVKKQRHLGWNRENVFEHNSHGRFVH